MALRKKKPIDRVDDNPRLVLHPKMTKQVKTFSLYQSSIDVLDKLKEKTGLSKSEILNQIIMSLEC